MDEAKIREIAERVVRELTQETPVAPVAPDVKMSARPAGAGIFETPDEAVEAARKAQRQYAQSGIELRKRVIEAMRQVGRSRAQELADMAADETKMGRPEHKRTKNEGAANLSPGVEEIQAQAETNEHGALLIERAPIGLINAITPTTNPTSTIINNAIIMLAGGNAVVFSPHPRAANCCLQTMALLNEAIVSAGGPPNLLTAVAEPSLRHASALMKHADVDAICATGGGGVVRAAMESGKKTWAAGPGNPPALVDETADLENAARAVIEGASFDNNLLCIGEKACVVVESAAEELLRRMKRHGGRLLRANELPRLMSAVLTEEGKHCAEMIGQNASVLLEAAGVRGSADDLAVLVETSADHVLAMEEFLTPIVPIVRVRSFEEAVQVCVQIEGGRGHTAMIHTARMDRVGEYARAMQVGILVANAPSFVCGGIGGPGFLAMSVAGRTGEGFTRPSHFTTERRMSLIGGLSLFSG